MEATLDLDGNIRRAPLLERYGKEVYPSLSLAVLRAALDNPALTLEFEMRRRGAEHPSFDPVVAAGPRGALPHADPSQAEVRAGGAVLSPFANSTYLTFSVRPEISSSTATASVFVASSPPPTL